MAGEVTDKMTLGEFVLRCVRGECPGRAFESEAFIDMLNAEAELEEALNADPIEQHNNGGPLRTDRIIQIQSRINEAQKNLDNLGRMLKLVREWKSPDSQFKARVLSILQSSIAFADDPKGLIPSLEHAQNQTQLQAWEDHVRDLENAAKKSREQYLQLSKESESHRELEKKLIKSLR